MPLPYQGNICTLDGADMENNLIDDAGFDLGIPTLLECWKQQAHLLACEVGDLQRGLSNARRNVHQLVITHTQAARIDASGTVTAR